MTHTLVYSDEQKDIYSVQVTVERMETVQSGSMQFSHPRYITFGQIVIFTDLPIEESSGMLIFKRGQEPELEQLISHISHEKERPSDGLFFDDKK